VPLLLVVNNKENWKLDIPGVEVVSARRYLTDPAYISMRGVKLYNLCRSYAYQSLGYYVSLLAEARGHRAQPSVAAIQDLRSQVATATVSEELDSLIQKSFSRITSEEHTLSIYFGRSLTKRDQRLAAALCIQFQAPLLRARFERAGGSGWRLAHVGPIPASEIPQSHLPFVVEAATEYFQNRSWAQRRERRPRAHFAILHDPEEAASPSNPRALVKFRRAAKELGIAAELITKADFAHIASYDALFIRATTYVNHYTWRFARRAAAEGLVVVDDPQSILRCTNKVYLAELLQHHKVRTPRTLIVHKDNRDRVITELGLPCVLKQPDSAFSMGVKKATTPEELKANLDALLEESDLVIAQEFLPTDYDWRVGVFDRRPLYVCRYFMAEGHWQIVSRSGVETDYGRIETLPVGQAPAQVVRTALRAANLIGDGLYGVDLKQSGKDVYVIEVNDNPNIDAGFEDRVLGDELYIAIMRGMLARVEERG
jgi:glutathione synthase/RimK-type ligase-like ATP-grasp enzyme